MGPISGDSHFTAADGHAGSQIHLRAGAPTDDPNREGFRGRLGNVAGALRQTGGLFEAVRARPLVSLGLAFSAGFVIAASRPLPEHSNWAVERTRRRIRAAILSGLTAILAEEIREMVTGEESLAEFLRAFVSDEADEEFREF